MDKREASGYTLETEEENSSYLCVTITDSSTWDKHIQNISNKGNRTIGFIQRNRPSVSG